MSFKKENASGEERWEAGKKAEKKGHKPYFPSFTALRWLYICALDGRKLPAKVNEANAYLIKLPEEGKDINLYCLTYNKAKEYYESTPYLLRWNGNDFKAEKVKEEDI